MILSIMNKKQSESFLTIKKPWIGGNGDTIYLGIPANIVKQLQITENNFLMIDLIDDIIIIKKHNPQFTKQELGKTESYSNNSSNHERLSTENEIITKDFKNPLNRLDNI